MPKIRNGYAEKVITRTETFYICSCTEMSPDYKTEENKYGIKENVIFNVFGLELPIDENGNITLDTAEKAVKQLYPKRKIISVDTISKTDCKIKVDYFTAVNFGKVVEIKEKAEGAEIE